MFEQWKRAWQDAVENFRRELEPESGAGPLSGAASRTMHRELVAARAALRQMTDEVERVRRSLEEERAEEQVCRRREAMARRIEDEETARVAVEFAERHAQRAAILERKLSVLTEEHALHAGELESMEAALRQRVAQDEQAAQRGVGGGASAAEDAGIGTAADPLDPGPRDAEFRRMERAARERAAEERLEELRKRMR